ncbi:MAG: cobalamin-dependent protein, partial [Gemmatimonadota bacterium]
AGQLHELGAMLAATSAGGHGWRVVYLGPNLPAEELARAAQVARADAIALSVIYPIDDQKVADELRRLRRLLPPKVSLVVGGGGATSYTGVLREIGAVTIGPLSDLRRWLRDEGQRILAGQRPA